MQESWARNDRWFRGRELCSGGDVFDAIIAHAFFPDAAFKIGHIRVGVKMGLLDDRITATDATTPQFWTPLPGCVSILASAVPLSNSG
jgi:hypothetical protein